MADLYVHPALAGRMAGVGACDRYIRLGVRTVELCVSVQAVTSPEGIVGHLLSLDLDEHGFTAWQVAPLAIYPHGKLKHAEEDARIVGAKLSLRVRTADPNAGWQWIYDPDGPRVQIATESDLMIG